jgi:hypothetical protein
VRMPSGPRGGRCRLRDGGPQAPRASSPCRASRSCATVRTMPPSGLALAPPDLHPQADRGPLRIAKAVAPVGGSVPGDGVSGTRLRRAAGLLSPGLPTSACGHVFVQRPPVARGRASCCLGAPRPARPPAGRVQRRRCVVDNEAMPRARARATSARAREDAAARAGGRGAGGRAHARGLLAGAGRTGGG